MSPPASGNPGAWLPWPVVEQVLKLDLRPGSRRRVFLAILFTSARYGGRDALLGVADLTRMTGLSPRTVKSAIAALRAAGLIVRVGRYRRLAVPLLAAARSAGASEDAPRQGATFTRRQESAMAAVLAEASLLLGSDASHLTMPEDRAEGLGLPRPVTYAEARARLTDSATAGQVAAFVGAVLATPRR